MILVHGFLGSKLYLSGDNIEYPAGHKCAVNQTTYHKAWISKVQLVRNKDCEFYWMGLNYNNASGTFKNRSGLDVRFQYEQNENSSIDSIQCLWSDWSYYCTVKYFQPLVTKLKQIGYTPNVNLLAAVYDWRQHPTSVELDNFYYGLKAKIVRAVQKSRRRVVLIAHSYGNIIINQFFRAWTDQKWQEEHIESTINVAAPFGGSAHAAHGLMVGEDQVFAKLTLVPAVIIRDFMRSLISPAILLPRPAAFNSTHVFIRIAGFGTYTVDNMDALLAMSQSEHLWPIYERYEITPKGRENIPMHCVYGLGTQNTPMEMQFASKQDFDDGKQPTLVYGDGDGTVNIESLRLCREWKERGDVKEVSIKEIPGPEHEEILEDKQFIKYVVELLLIRNGGNGSLRKLLPAEMFATSMDGIGNRHFTQRRMYTHQADGILCISEQQYATCPNGTTPRRWTWANVHFACFDPAKSSTGRLIAAELLRNERQQKQQSGQAAEGRLDQLIWRAKRKHEKRGSENGINWLTSMEERREAIPLTCIPSD